MANPHCGIARLCRHLDEAGRREVGRLVNEPATRPGMPDRTLARALMQLAAVRDADVRIHRQTVGNHRRGQCACE